MPATDPTSSAVHAASVSALQRVAVHVVARARQQATGRFSLRVTPGGFGTPEFGPEARRVRVAGAFLFVESDAPEAASTRARRIDGSTLRELADLASVDLAAPLDVGADAPALADVDLPITLDSAVASRLADWYGVVAAALDGVVADLPEWAGASITRVWPEHFDVAVDVTAAPGVRVNLGGSPGDASIAEPYLYVGPWTDDRPGERRFWNAPFGAARTRSELTPDDPVPAAIEFYREGWRRLTRGA